MGNEPRYWRIRMNFGTGGKDVAKPAWENDKVGIWYGGWSAKDLEEALQKGTPDEQRDWLSNVPAQRQLFEVTWQFFDTSLRFKRIRELDWVYVYFDDALHFAHVTGPLESDGDSKFNEKNPSFPSAPPELFKYRSIGAKKSFRLGRLPASFLILRSAGRSNVYEHNNSYWHLVKMLAECEDESEVVERFRHLSLSEWLEWADDKTWEAICEGYLIFEKDFVPTGLGIGGTLADLDIVGYSKGGTRILAQCKKHPTPLAVEDGFVSLCADFPDPKELYYFAFGGIVDAPADVRAVDKVSMQKWMETSTNGRLYRRLLGLA